MNATMIRARIEITIPDINLTNTGSFPLARVDPGLSIAELGLVELEEIEVGISITVLGAGETEELDTFPRGG
jgi:hypothetical protein